MKILAYAAFPKRGATRGGFVILREYPESGEFVTAIIYAETSLDVDRSPSPRPRFEGEPALPYPTIEQHSQGEYFRYVGNTGAEGLHVEGTRENALLNARLSFMQRVEREMRRVLA